MQKICSKSLPSDSFLTKSNNEYITALNSANAPIRKYLVRQSQNQNSNLITEFILSGALDPEAITQEILSISKEFSSFVLPVKDVVAKTISPELKQVTLIHPEAIELENELPPHYKYSEVEIIAIIKVLLTVLEIKIRLKFPLELTADPSFIYRIKDKYLLYPYYRVSRHHLSQYTYEVEEKFSQFDIGMLASFLYLGISREELTVSKKAPEQIVQQLKQQKASLEFTEFISVLLTGVETELTRVRELIKCTDNLKTKQFTDQHRQSVSAELAIWNYHTEEINPGKPANHQRTGHLDTVTSIVISSDGSFMASSSHDCSIKIYDLKHYELIHSFSHAHNESILILGLSKDNSMLALGTRNGVVKMIDLKSLRFYYDFGSISQDSIIGVDFIKDDKFLIAVSSNSTVVVIDILNKAISKVLTNLYPSSTDCSLVCDSQQLLIVAGRTEIVCFWKLDGYNRAGNLRSSIGGIWSMALSPEVKAASHCWSVRRNPNFQTCDSSFNYEIQTPKFCVVFYPRERFLAVTGFDRSIRIYDLFKRNIRKNLQEFHSDWILSLAMTKNGSLLISGSQDSSIKVFDAHTGIELHNFRTSPNHEVRCMTTTSDDKYLVAGSGDGCIYIYDYFNFKLVHNIKKAHDHCVLALAVTNSMKYIVSGSADKSVKIFDFEEKKICHVFENAHSGWVLGLAVSWDSRVIVTSSYDLSINKYNIESKTLNYTIWEAHAEAIRALLITRDNQFIVSGSDDHSIKIFNIENGFLIRAIHEADISRIRCLQITKNNGFIISGSNAGSVRIFDFDTGALFRSYDNLHDYQIVTILLLEEEKYLLTGAANGSIKILNLTNFQLVLTRSLTHEGGVVTSAISSKDKTKFMTGGRDSFIRFFKMIEYDF